MLILRWFSFIEMISEDGSGKATKEVELNAIIKYSLDLACDQEARLDVVDSKLFAVKGFLEGLFACRD
jgi:hypothetical protein